MSDPIQFRTFEVNRKDWGTTRVVEEEFDGALSENQVLLKIDRFALTSNNISYCAAGDMLGYWGFFPASDDFGRVPAMGYADVAASNHPDVKVGERFWGFYPMGNYLIVSAGKHGPTGFSDVSEHRQTYAPIYSGFSRTSANPDYKKAREDHDLLLRGLFLTSWLAEDFMHDNDTFGADDYLITSASSKTSISLAYVVKQRGEKRSIGITSARNLDFCKDLGCYDSLITYDEVSELDATRPVVVVDMAGNKTVLRALHEHYRDNMKYSCQVGATHVGSVEVDTDNMPGATPEFFFAPGQAQKRNGEWGAGQVEMRVGESLQSFHDFSDRWLTVQSGYGPDAIDATFKRVLAGNASPSEGLILSMEATS